MAFWNVAGIERKDRGFWTGIKEWDVVILTETWLEEKGWDRIRSKLPREFIWETQLARRKNKKGRAMGGMLMGVRKGIEVRKERGKEGSEGIMTKVIKIGGEDWRVIGVYVNGDMEEKWGKIKDWVEDKGDGVRKILGGDLNARTGEMGGWWEGRDEKGKEEGRKSKDKKINKEGRFLVDRLEEVGWYIFNGCGKGDTEGMWTYAGGRGESVLDYVIGDEEVWDRVVKMEVEGKIESDHFPVVVSIKDEKRGSDSRGGNVRKRWRWTEEGKELFRERMEKVWEEKGIEGRKGWEILKEEIQGVLQEGQGREGTEGEKGWWDVECREGKRKVRRELREWRRGRGGGDRYRVVKREYNKLCERKKKEESEKWIEMAKKARTEGQVWWVVNKERKRRRNIDDGIGIEEWVEYFKEVLGGVERKVVRGIRGERREDAEVEITREEVRKALGKIKDGKAIGGDGIPGEVWKYGGERLEGYVWEICNRIWKGEEWIEEWNEGIIVPIKKKGEGDKVGDYRGVTITSSLYKVYAKILGERLGKEIDEKKIIPHNQTGFRRGMGTVDNIFVLNYMVNRQVSKEKGKMVAFFVDLKAAFDSVDRGVLEKTLRERGVSVGIVKRSMDLMRETRNRVRRGEEMSEVFWTSKGVRQGCPISPGLFNVLTADLEEYMRKGRWGGVRLKGEKVYSLAYADDIVLLAEEEEGMRAMIARMERYVREKGLMVNIEKSKILRFGKGGGRRKKISWRWEGKIIEEVNKYNYLGYVFQRNGGQEEQAKERARRGMRVMGQVWGIGKRKFGGDWGKRLWLFDALVWTVMAYGVEIWGWKEREVMERVQEKYLKWVLGVKWKTPGYMVREEILRDKLRTRAGRRAWGYEERLAEGKGSDLARKCWEEIRERAQREGKMSNWEKERKGFFEDRGIKLGEMEREREEGVFDFCQGEERDRVRQGEERWGRIRESRSNKWYQRIKGKGIPEYLKKGWEENRWRRMARYRLGEGVRGRNFWESEEDRKCRMCGGDEETWEHVWEECGRWGTEGSWEEMVEKVLGEDGEGEEWLRKLEVFREGGGE